MDVYKEYKHSLNEINKAIDELPESEKYYWIRNRDELVRQGSK